MSSPPGVGESTSGGIDENVAGAFSYLFGFISGLILYVAKGDNEFVQFHATQSMIVFGGLVPLSFGLAFVQSFLAFIPLAGRFLTYIIGLFSLLLSPLAMVLWLLLMYKAYQGERYGLPFIGNWIDKSLLDVTGKSASDAPARR